MKKLRAVIVIILLLGAVVAAWHFLHNKTVSAPTKTSSQSQYNKKQFSLNDPSSLWIIANKTRPLSPINYAPVDLITPNVPLLYNKNDPRMKIRAVAATALEKLVTDAKRQGVNFMIASGYRSYGTQVTTYNSEVAAYGKAVADHESARPGYSEHQTGWAVDLATTNKKCLLQACFATTAEGKWLAAHAYQYGFVLRYQKKQ